MADYTLKLFDRDLIRFSARDTGDMPDGREPPACLKHGTTGVNCASGRKVESFSFERGKALQCGGRNGEIPCNLVLL